MIATAIALRISLSQEQIANHRANFEKLDDTNKAVAILQSHGYNYLRVCDRLGITTDKFHERRKIILAVLGCTREELPLVVFSALDLLAEHSL